MTLKETTELYLIALYEAGGKENLAKELRLYDERHMTFAVTYKVARSHILYFKRLIQNKPYKRKVNNLDTYFKAISSDKLLMMAITTSKFLRLDFKNFMDSLDDYVEDIILLVEEAINNPVVKESKPLDKTPVYVPKEPLPKVTKDDPYIVRARSLGRQKIETEYEKIKDTLITFTKIYINSYFNRVVYKLEEDIKLTGNITKPATRSKENYLKPESVFYGLEYIFKLNPKDMDYIKYKIENNEAGIAILDIIIEKLIRYFKLYHQTVIERPF